MIYVNAVVAICCRSGGCGVEGGSRRDRRCGLSLHAAIAGPKGAVEQLRFEDPRTQNQARPPAEERARRFDSDHCPWATPQPAQTV
jgi:hypothetical protein